MEGVYPRIVHDRFSKATEFCVGVAGSKRQSQLWISLQIRVSRCLKTICAEDHQTARASEGIVQSQRVRRQSLAQAKTQRPGRTRDC